MWDLPEPGVEPVSPAMGGGFFTTESPGKPGALILIFAKSKTLMKMVMFYKWHYCIVLWLNNIPLYIYYVAQETLLNTM